MRAIFGKTYTVEGRGEILVATRETKETCPKVDDIIIANGAMKRVVAVELRSGAMGVCYDDVGLVLGNVDSKEKVDKMQ